MPRLPLFLAAGILLTAASLAAQPDGTLSLSVPDVALRDQNGKVVHLYSDLIRGNPVVMNFVFTSCTTICSPMGANFGALQSKVERDVRLISISIDPGVDTPERLKRWSAQFQRGPSWTLLTGSRENVERALKALGAYTPNRFSHAPMLLVGDGQTNRWIRANGLVAPSEVVKMIRRTRTADQSAAEVSR
jgi:protein SCO1/2